MELAREVGKPMLIDFWASWCGPCRQMEFHLWSRADVLELADKFVCLRVDVDHHGEVARRYRADALPTVVVVDPWGTEIARRQGFRQPDEYLEILNGMPADFSELAPWQARLAQDADDFQALREIGLAYHRMQLFEVSTEFLREALDSRHADSDLDSIGEIHTVIGWNYLKTKKFKRAAKSFNRCLEKVPNYRSRDLTLYGLLAAWMASGKVRKAEEVFQQLETCCPDSPMTQRARLALRPDGESGAVASRE